MERTIRLQELKISDKGKQLIINYENCKLFAYPDPGSPLYKVNSKARWGDRPASEITQSFPASLRQLSGDPWTIGVGCTRYENNAKVKSTDHISLDRAYQLFYATLPKYELTIKGKIKRDLLQREFDAAVSFCFNAGVAYKAGNVWKDYNLWANINNRLSGKDMWNYWTTLAITAKGEVMNGLIRRRKSECTLYQTGELKFHF